MTGYSTLTRRLTDLLDPLPGESEAKQTYGKKIRDGKQSLFTSLLIIKIEQLGMRQVFVAIVANVFCRFFVHTRHDFSSAVA